jgi:hypothetical protein
LELKGRNLARVQVDVAEHRNQIGTALRKEYDSKLSRMQKDIASSLRKEYDAKLVDASRKINKLLASMSKVRFFVDEVDDGLKIEPAVLPIVPIPRVALDKMIPKDSWTDALMKSHQKVEMSKPLVRDVVDGSGLVFDKCAKKIYSFLYYNSPKSFTKVQIGAMIGYSPKSGGFNNSFARLNSAKALLASSDGWTINGDNILDIVIEDKAVYNLDLILSKLDKCSREILQVLLHNPDDTFVKDELASLTASNYSPNSGGFNNSIARLNALGYIKRSSGSIGLSDDLRELI